MYYFVSENDKLEKLQPRVPDNFLTRINAEDSKTPRVCVCSSIHDCLKALSMNLKDKTLYVYTINEKDVSVKKPYIKDVPDVNVTHELWILQPVTVKLSFKIKVTEAYTKPEVYTYTKDGKTHKAELYAWKYKILQTYSRKAEST